MRKTFVTVTESILDRDDRVVVLLGDIGVFGFREAMQRHPSRVINIGILEQSMVGVGAGLALGGHIPVLHTIAPFLVERALEQIKIDCAYQQLRGNLVTVGASMDYAALGATHHCPGDAGILLNVPGVEIYVPGTSSEFSQLFTSNYANSFLSYFRLAEFTNTISHPVTSGKANLIQKGSRALVIAVGPTLDIVEEAVRNEDVSLLYVTSLRPFDGVTVRELINSGEVLIVEPFYEGTTSIVVNEALRGKRISIRSIGIPRQFMHGYGTYEEQLGNANISVSRIRTELDEMLC